MNEFLRIGSTVLIAAIVFVCAFWAFDVLFILLSGNIHNGYFILLSLVLAVAAMMGAVRWWDRYLSRRYGD